MPTTTNKTNNTTSDAKKIKELEQIIAQLSQTIQTLQAQTTRDDIIYEDKDINPNKKTRITSLTHGYFSLYAPNRGFLKFPKYGSYHTVSYAQLVDYVNACRAAAENGNFYIHSREMVEDLGLAEAYETLLNDKLIEKLLDSDELKARDILPNVSQTQKDNICRLVCEKIYNKEIVNIDKIDEISKAIGVDILKKVNEMKDVNEFLSKD